MYYYYFPQFKVNKDTLEALPASSWLSFLQVISTGMGFPHPRLLGERSCRVCWIADIEAGKRLRIPRCFALRLLSFASVC
jgi:hypothetical protein